MAPEVLVVGAGYAGVAAIETLQDANRPVDLTWIDPAPYHEVKHEIHRVIRTPEIASGLRVPRDAIAASSTQVIEDEAVAIAPDARTLTLREGGTVTYDYLLLTVGARTAFYAIPGLEEQAHLLETAADARRIHAALVDADSPRVAVGGGGLSGVQSAGEVAALRPDADVTVIEALDSILPNAASPLQRAVASALEARGIDVRTDAPVVETTPREVILQGEEHLPYDVLVWAGGLTGRDIDHGGTLEQERNRIAAGATLQTSDARIFACGDAAAIDQPDGIAPASAQAAWQAAPVAARNVLSAIQDRPLDSWTFADKGTLVSIGDTAIAYDVRGIPLGVFDGPAATLLKKLVAIRWIGQVGTYRQALQLWRAL